MKMAIFKRISVVGLFLSLTSCQIATVYLNTDLKEYNVHLYLEEYTPKLNKIPPEYKGKVMCLANLRNDSQNTANFSYFSKDNKAQYLLSTRAGTNIQPIPNFFWSAYEKAFARAGITTMTRCENDMPEMWIIFRSFDDEELKFRIHLYINREAVFEKEMTIIMPPAENRNSIALQARAYDMIDLTIKTILREPGVKAAFF